jgi:N-acetyltransferase 10
VHYQLKELQANLADTKPVGDLVKLAKTVDQAQAILTFVDAIAEKTLSSTVTLTAARGRGKSAALGLAIAAALAHGYSNVFVTSPSPENLKTLFDFIFKGMDVLGYEEHLDYDIVQSTNPDFNKAIVRVNIFRQHRQTIQVCTYRDVIRRSLMLRYSISNLRTRMCWVKPSWLSSTRPQLSLFL